MTSKNSRAHAAPPFKNEEVLRALSVFLPEVVLEAAEREFTGSPDDPFQGHITDAVLLIMSTLSEELAARVIAYCPELAVQVQHVLSDPEEFIQSLRDDNVE